MLSNHPEGLNMAEALTAGTQNSIYPVELGPALADSVGKTNFQQIHLREFNLETPIPVEKSKEYYQSAVVDPAQRLADAVTKLENK